MIQEITVRFDKAIRDKFAHKADIQNYILKHERKHICIQNLAEQILRAEKYNIALSVSTYDTVIKDVALLFAKTVIEHVEQQHMSSIQKAQLTARQDALKEAEQMLKDLEKDSMNEKGLTQIERDLIKHEHQKRNQSNRTTDKV